MSRLIIFVGLVLIFGVVIATNESKINSSSFVATEEWQVVEKGKPIPQGLHVRHNFQTGITEAKLLDKNEEKDTKVSSDSLPTSSLTLHPQKSIKNDDSIATKKKLYGKHMISKDDLRKMIEKFQSHEDEGNDVPLSEKMERKQEAEEQASKMYSNLMEGKTVMKTVTNSEAFEILFERFEPYGKLMSSGNLDPNNIDDVVNILANIEYLVHQIDYAQIFSDMNGMARIVLPSLNATYYRIQHEALRLLGAAVQNNPKVQLKALENDLVQKLLHMLVVTNDNMTKQVRIMFTLGALLRNCPAAQKTLISNGGLQMFGKILMDRNFVIQTRILNLINDLAIERINLEKIEDQKERISLIKDYETTNFEKEIVNQKYCQNLVSLMIKVPEMYNDANLEDLCEVVYNSMIVLSYACKNEYVQRKQELLHKVHALYDMFSLPEGYNGPELLIEVLKMLVTLKHDEL
ncbi:nucleotide exchange factor SIL1 [Trichogramma pretiosum]|uniref:nucleotide exchange factor SIL1 n=1 Tax=Trichogramma pretiosum TaxID=7493 RepID=UPI0006C964C5|nr:nucleotide exchange factor SIL1 [Trichogramma pretiosum]